MANVKRVASRAEIPAGGMCQFEVDGQEILCVDVAGTIHAVSALCTHAMGFLEDGDLEGFEIVCPLHSAAFDVRTGAVTRPPAERALTCYRVHVEGDDVLVEWPD